MPYLALVGATVHTEPDEEPLRDATVLVHDATIVAVRDRETVEIPASAQVVDCAGHSVTAGFWNSHVHFMENKWADAAAIPAPELADQLADMFLGYGFTSVFDISSDWANTQRIRDRIESGEVPGPDIRSTGPGLTAIGATPSRETLRALGFLPGAVGVTDPDDALVAAAKLLDQGADGIKVHLQRPAAGYAPISGAAISAVVDVAHRRGKPVFLHPNDPADVRLGARCDVDVIAHTTLRSSWDEALLDTMLEHDVAVTPTLTVWRSVMRHDRASVLRQLEEGLMAQLGAWSEAGGTVLFGTDVGAADYDPHPEYVLMTQAGLHFPRLLASLTTAPAERFGQGHRLGRVAAGYAADLVVLDGDPATDLGALTRVRLTLRGGRIVHR